jgi:hypothetical protein
MRRKFISLALIAAFAVLLAGCNKDAEFNSFSDDLDSMTQEMVKKVDDNPTAAGVDEAQKYFDSKKSDLKAKFDALKSAREAQISEEAKKKFTDSLTKNMMAVAGLQTKHIGQSMRDPAFKSKIEKLTQDYRDLFVI